MSNTKTDAIFQLTAPYDNPFQGKDTRALCVCSAGLLRSPTLANVLIKHGWNARACGSYVDLALIPISLNLISWANRIIFAQKENYDATLKLFSHNTDVVQEILSKSIVLNIEDDSNYNHPRLIRQLITGLAKHDIHIDLNSILSEP